MFFAGDYDRRHTILFRAVPGGACSEKAVCFCGVVATKHAAFVFEAGKRQQIKKHERECD
jgi:hypothetical protein